MLTSSLMNSIVSDRFSSQGFPSHRVNLTSTEVSASHENSGELYPTLIPCVPDNVPTSEVYVHR